jgi:glutamine---fructose-6-phosphate transaminase (isomerizing)
MCGIIGILGSTPAHPRLIAALKKVEYRGYDSAGIATLEDGEIRRVRTPGKVAGLEEAVLAVGLTGASGIGHTRWATHGKPTEANAHPHATERVAVVHNGIIENFRELRAELEAGGAVFQSETDTEVITQLISHHMDNGVSPRDAAAKTLGRLQGAFAIAVLFAGENDLMIGARRGSPLAIGIGEGEMFLGSDQLALSPCTKQVVYLEEGDWAVITRGSWEVFDAAGKAVQRPVSHVGESQAASEKGNYRHYMQKEIHEQAETTSRTIGALVDPSALTVPDIAQGKVDFASARRVVMVACGTAHFASRVAEYWFEQVGGIAAKTDVASEFRYRQPVLDAGDIAMLISQSGETADTLEALRIAKAAGMTTVGVVNVHGSAIWREADARVPTLAGPEISVASTKAFTAQLGALAAAAIACGRARGKLTPADENRLVRTLLETPRMVAEVLKLEPEIEKMAIGLSRARDVLYLGRGVHSALALEGALKLKEISYIHAEGYQAGELKHGPIALIEPATPTIVIAPTDALFDKTVSSMEQVRARGGPVILITDEAGAKVAAKSADQVIIGPDCDPFIAPIVYSVPVQLIAYHVAVAKGTDVDQPRNLAKSVTVE